MPNLISTRKCFFGNGNIRQHFQELSGAPLTNQQLEYSLRSCFKGNSTNSAKVQITIYAKFDFLKNSYIMVPSIGFLLLKIIKTEAKIFILVPCLHFCLLPLDAHHQCLQTHLMYQIIFSPKRFILHIFEKENKLATYSL